MTWRLYFSMVRAAIQQALIYRFNTLLQGSIGTVFIVAEIVMGYVLYQFTPNIFGWSRFDFLLVVAVSNIMGQTVRMLFLRSCYQLYSAIIQGQLDYTLLRPADSLWYWSLRAFAPSYLINIVGVCGYLVFLLWGHPLSLWQILQFIVLMGVGVYFVFLMYMLPILLPFFSDGLRVVLMLPEALLAMSGRPYVVYPAVIRVLLLYVVPILLATNAPVLILRGHLPPLMWGAMLAFIVLGTWLMRWMWNAGLRRYASAA